MTSRGFDNPVLKAVKSQLGQSDRQGMPLPEVPTRTISSEDILELFALRAESAGAQCTKAENIQGARKQLLALFRSTNMRSVAGSNGTIVSKVLKEMPDDVTLVDTIDDRERLFNVDAGVTEVQWAIAETGTLVLASSSERHRLTSLIPAVHVALVPASKIVATMPSVLKQLAASDQQHQATTFITGPSRTADIELTLVVGVHGPKELHAIILMDA